MSEPSAQTETELLVELVRAIANEGLPTSLSKQSATAIRDYIGVAARGADSETGDILRAYATASSAEGSMTALDGTVAGPERVCLLNGAFGHTLDYDDTFSSFPLHPTTVVVPALLAASELTGADGDTFLRAYAAGVETLYRVGQSVFPTQYDRGFHSTAAVGPLGATAATGVIFELDRPTLRDAFGIAASSAGGLRKNFGTTTKPLHAGFAASAGLRAAILAREGATAHADVIGGDSGYGVAMAGNDFDSSVFDSEEHFGVEDIALKLYPSAHISHGPMEALRQLREREGLSTEDIASVTATMHPGGSDVLIHSDPSNALEAKFSIEFSLAAVLRSGDPGLAEFTDAYVTDTATRAAMKLVEVEYDADVVADLGRYGGRVVVETIDGRTLEAAAGAPGSPENPASEERLRQKFDECMARSPLDGDRIAAEIEKLTDGNDVASFLDALVLEE